MRITELHDALSEAASSFQKISDEYVEKSDEIKGENQLVSALLGELLDYLIVTGASAATATYTSETVVGGIVFGGVTVYLVKCVVDIVIELFAAYGRAEQFVSGLSSFLQGFGVIDGDSPLPKVPGVLKLPG